MTTETVLYATLANDPGVGALVGGTGDAARVYQDFVPARDDGGDAELPAAAYARGETSYINNIHSPAPIAERANMEIWCLAWTRDEANALADAVIAACANAQFTITGRSAADTQEENAIIATVVNVQRLTML